VQVEEEVRELRGREHLALDPPPRADEERGDAGVAAHERAGDRESLALAARETIAALAQHGVVAVRQRLDELVRLRQPRDALHLRVVEPGGAEGDVLAHGGGKEEGIL
jgi:hypothetical protein